ncbi:argininosuccinate synthase [Halorubrum sp. JWXQ-INN 858]|uniref:argininosuccinate synthase n=1 Tax=Halorubrum sp. JWXQ-INN 858 TaxID=2690782 RepID=UPI00135AE141|nr:argininosuccinate synthase [Halorubrum sp. JWXQ-INN 858]MWV63528.1 argininosuccinate synthase [Halorubrum sp. JWXQ-INN 858]
MAKAALAFSGGLDTTVCVPLLKEEYGYDEVIGVTVDVGQPGEEFDEAYETAEALGLEHYVVDAKEEFADLCFDAVKANATYQGYPLGTALARPVIAEAILGVAEEQGCEAIAHGCTGKGNDQLRFEAVWRGSDLEVIAPVRELGLTREWEIEYAAEKELPVEAGNSGVWSIDTNIWSRAVEGGKLENPDYEPPEDIYEWTAHPEGETTIEVAFEGGVPVAVDGEEMDPVPLIQHLNEYAGKFGVGRTDVMEDRMLGLKVRENYEHPAATVLLTAHGALEDLVLTKNERSFKKGIEQEWSEKAYQGLTFAPVVDALNAFVDETQDVVTGTATVKVSGGNCRVVARDSEYAVYSEEMASFNTEDVAGIAQEDATGVAKYHGLQERLANNVKKGVSKPELATDGSGDVDEN